MASFPAVAPTRPLLMIPGPTEYDSSVLSKLGEPSPAHTAAGFIAEFSSALKSLRQVHRTSTGQPFILSGSGTLGWDLISANLCESGDSALVVNTGYFSDSFSDCLKVYGVNVTTLQCETIGESVSLERFESELKSLKESNSKIKLIVLTQVDTSTAVLNNIHEFTKLIKKYLPESFIAVDGVCSFGGEIFEFDAWEIDAAMSCSQKSLGTPPGLCTLILSSRALEYVKTRKTPIASYFGSLLRWLPIMENYEKLLPSYFATPNVNLIRALDVALKNLLSQGMEQIWSNHSNHSKALKLSLESIGLKQVPSQINNRANTLSAFYYPDEIDSGLFLKSILSSSIIVAGGLHKDIKTKYFRIGHMGISVNNKRNDLQKVVQAVCDALNTAGYKCDTEKTVELYKQTLQKSITENNNNTTSNGH